MTAPLSFRPEFTAPLPRIAAATRPRAGARLLVIDPTSRRFADRDIADLPDLLAPGDLLVLNDAATFPASIAGTIRGRPHELRLLAAEQETLAVVFGAGDWRTPTEKRPAPIVEPDDEFRFGESTAHLIAPDERSPRLWRVRFDDAGPALLHALYRWGRPIQYSYQAADLPLSAVQTPFAGRPWAAEMPSAGRALSASILARARSRGVGIATLTHAAGLSATGDDALDALLPLPERFELPRATLAAIRHTHATPGRVVAVGTTVARALEGAARLGFPARGVTDHLLGDGVPLRVVDGLVSGVHVPGESHYHVLESFAARDLLDAAVRHAAEAGYQNHELGDNTLVLAGALG